MTNIPSDSLTPTDDNVKWSGDAGGGQSTERNTSTCTSGISWGESTEIAPEEQAAPAHQANAHGPSIGDGNEDDDFPFYPSPNLLIYLAFAGLFLYLAIGILANTWSPNAIHRRLWNS